MRRFNPVDNSASHITIPHTPPYPTNNFVLKKIRSEQECSLDTPFGAHDDIVKQR